MQDQWTDRLSEYLDDELSGEGRRGLEAHLATCTVCAQTLDELKKVVAAAHALSALPPVNDLWNGIGTRLDCERTGVGPREAVSRWRRVWRQPRHIWFTLPQL